MATVPSPRTWVTGEVVTAAYMNGLRDNDLFLLGGSAGQRPGFLAIQNAVQSIPNSAETQTIYQSVVRDNDSGYNSGTGLYTVNTTGLWVFTSATQFASNGTGLRALHFLGFENAWCWIVASTDASGRMSLSAINYITAANTVRVNQYQTSGAALNTQGDSTVSFGGVWISS